MFQKGVHRRDFLRLGSVAAAGIAATTISAKSLDTITRIEGVEPILSVGFAEVTDNDSAGLVPANALPSGDGKFSTSAARVTINGLWSAETRESSPAVYVSAFFHTTTGAIPFLAWSSAGSVSPRLSFNVDLDGRDRLSLGIERERVRGSRAFSRHMARVFGFARDGADDLPKAEVLETSGSLCHLEIGRGSGTKLRAGTYVFALRRTSADRAPDWRTLTVDVEQLRGNGESILRAGNIPVAFDYLVVSVNHA